MISSKIASSSAKPRAWISGPLATLPVTESTTTITEMKPSSPRIRRSLRSDSVMSPTERAVDEDVAAVDLAGDLRDAVDEVDDDAVLGDHDVLGGTPVARASSALASMCRISPCTGSTLRGLTML